MRAITRMRAKSNVVKIEPTVKKEPKEEAGNEQAGPQTTSMTETNEHDSKPVPSANQASRRTKGPISMDEPPNWLQMIENIRLMRRKVPAPVDTMGCSQSRDADQDADKYQEKDAQINGRFRVLVSLMLSSQTKDPITWAAVQKLSEKGLCNAKALARADETDIEQLIYPVGFYRRKATGLKRVAQILEKDYDCDIPASIKELCDLPGVGPKMAHLCMAEAWNVVSGIGVDTHVHRISQRLGWVPSKGIKSPEDTRMALESWMPHEYWREINLLLVGFGQTICKPIGPNCSECYNNLICPSSSLGKSRSSQAQRSPAGKKTKGRTRIKLEA